MALNTAGDLITFALKTAGVNGVGQTPSAEDSNDSLVLLSSMVAQWQRKRWLVWSLAETVLVSTGAASYTVTPGGNFSIARPDRIDSAFARLNASGPNPIDFGLGIVESREDYNAKALKSQSTFPAAVFYESAFPIGVLHFWPIPPATLYELHIFTKAALPGYANLTDPLNLPPEYLEAAIYSLTVRLALNFGMDPRPAHVAAARAALNTIRLANTQIGVLAMPAELAPRHSGGIAAGSDPAFQTGSW